MIQRDTSQSPETSKCVSALLRIKLFITQKKKQNRALILDFRKTNISSSTSVVASLCGNSMSAVGAVGSVDVRKSWDQDQLAL